MDDRLAAIRDAVRAGKTRDGSSHDGDAREGKEQEAAVRARQLADALAADCAPAIEQIAGRQCRAVHRPDLLADAVQNALIDVMRELRTGTERANHRTYLRIITCNAVSRTVTAHGALYPTASQRRQASIAAAGARHVAEHGTQPAGSELLAAQHALVAGRADAKDQAALATIEEVHAYLAGETPFVEDGERYDDGYGKRKESTESRLPRQTDHSEDDLALDPLDTQRLIRATAVAFPDPRPWVDGAAFATAVMTSCMLGTFSEHDLAEECGLTRSVTRTAVINVWKTAGRIAVEIGITSVRAGLTPAPHTRPRTGARRRRGDQEWTALTARGSRGAGGLPGPHRRQSVDRPPPRTAGRRRARHHPGATLLG